MFLLATVTLCCGAVAGTLAVLEPAMGPPTERLVAERATAEPPQASLQTPVRVVGAPFEPNVNPRQR